MKQITAFETSDGRICKTALEAAEYEAVEVLTKIIDNRPIALKIIAEIDKVADVILSVTAEQARITVA